MRDKLEVGKKVVSSEHVALNKLFKVKHTWKYVQVYLLTIAVLFNVLLF